MSKSKEIQEEYLNLRNKVEGKIKELEGKLSVNQSQSNSNLVLPTPMMSNLPLYSCHHKCHHHHCRQNCHQTAQFMYPGGNEIGISDCQGSISKQSLSKNGSVNELISEALVQSLKNQRQINDNIKAINEKIENISVQQNNRSYLSQAFSESVSKNKKSMRGGTNLMKGDRQKQRCFSEIKTESEPLSKFKSPLGSKAQLKKVKSRPKEIENIYSINTKKPKKVKAKDKSSTKFKSEYFLSFGCPIHSPNKVSTISPQGKEIYKDSQHRNRKHQKNHLLQSFSQQQRSRKQLIDKISQKVFQDYGRP